MAMKKLHLIITRAERTDLAPELMDQMGKVESMKNQAKTFMERIRRSAQPNKQHRSNDRLVSADETLNEKLSLVSAFRESATGCFSDHPAIVTYMNQVAEVYDDLNKYQDKFLRQVQIYCINELKKFTDETYVNIKQAFDDLRQKLTEYDYARDRLRKCKPAEIEQRGKDATACQKNFEQQALQLYNLLKRIPEYQMELAKIINVMARAECEYYRLGFDAFRRIRPPDRIKSDTIKIRPGDTIRPTASTTATGSDTIRAKGGKTVRVPPAGTTIRGSSPAKSNPSMKSKEWP